MASAANGNEDNRAETQDDPPGWKYWHIPRLHTCQHCDRIVITHHELKHCLISLPHTKPEALQARADNCPVFCMLNESLRMFPYRHGSPLDFVKFLFDPNYPERGYSPLESTASLSRIAAQKKARSNNKANLLWRTRFILGSLRRRYFNLFLGPESLYVLRGTTAIDCVGQFEILEGHEGVIDLDGDLFRHLLHRRFDTREFYVNLKTFISNCVSSHRVCQISPIGFVPSRLLEVSPGSDPNHIRLVETTTDGQKSWACLSYVWGGDQHHKTTMSILSEYLTDICLDVLPQTIKDAVSVCRGLGIDYLWIDSFCIVQDDEVDKAREIPQMALIYRHALLTIAASRAHTVDEGFLHHVSPLCYLRFAPTSLRFRDRCGRESKVVILAERISHAMSHKPKEPIDARAWALQEQLLSPRLLSYTSHGPQWSCRCLLQHVNGHPDRTSFPRFAASYPNLGGGEVVPCIPGLKMQAWESVVQLYSPRRATLQSDKLVGLSAVARTYSENDEECGSYLAGIWEHSLPNSLMWAVLTEDIRRKPPEYRAPSWSWASVDGAVQYREKYMKADYDFKIISAQTRKVDGNEFGAVTDGTLVVDARVRDCRVRKESKNLSSNVQYFSIVDGPEVWFKADTTEFQTLICNEGTEVTLLLVARRSKWRYGLVLIKNKDGSSFSRVSYVDFHESTWGESRLKSEQFFERSEIRRVTIV